MNSESSPEFEESLPVFGRLAGIDFGTVRIGIAICDPDQNIASPYENYNRRNNKLDEEYFVNLSSENRLVGFVVGLPLHMSGDESRKSIEAREFGRWLQRTTGLPITWCDERYSTAFARELLRSQNIKGKKAKAKLDKIAAHAILAAFLESRHSNNANQPLDDKESSD